MAQKFEWDDEDPMVAGGYDTSTEPEVQTPPPASGPPRGAKAPPMPSPKPVKVIQANPNLIEKIVEDYEEDSPDPAELNEAEWRLEKAGYYRTVMNSQLLSSDHPAAIEVEQELQDWAKGRLEQLLGLRIEPTNDKPVQVIESVKVPFNEDEVGALKALAARVLGKKEQTIAPATVAAPSKPAVTPATSKPRPTIKPVEVADSSPKRGRGRPRKPCRICGQLVCEHKRDKPAQEASPPSPAGETFDGHPIQHLPDGTPFIDVDNRRYKLERRKVTHKETGEVREAIVPVELAKKDKDPNIKPFPSEQEMQMMAAAEAQRNLRAVEQIQAVANVGGAPQRISGATLIQAALQAPEKEAYIPEPPPRKR